MGFCKGEHNPQRSQLNQWDDVTACRDCGHWIQVHPDVRSKNPNFETAKKARR